MPSLKINAKVGAIYYQQVLIYLCSGPEFLSPPESDRTNITKEARDKRDQREQTKGSKDKKNTHTQVGVKQNRDFILLQHSFII